VTKFGYFNPWLFLGSGLLAIGGGVLSTFDIHTTSSMINGIQVLVGMGSSIVIQMVSNSSYNMQSPSTNTST
jgi:hypothetical protein